MPRYKDCDKEERRYDRGGGYRGGDLNINSNQFNRGGRGDGGLNARGTRLYIGRLSSRTRSQDLEDLFSKYGRVQDVDMKHNFAFVEFLDARDADDARHYTNGKDLNGSQLIVEFARRGPRSLGGAHEYLGRSPPPGTGRCYNCGNEGHWARDCKAGDWRDKCYRCGQHGHIECNCQNSPASKSSLSRSRSRSPQRDNKPQKKKFRSQSRSYSPSPARKDCSSPIKDSQKESLHSKSRSLSPPLKICNISPSPVGLNVSANQSPAHHSHNPKPPQVEESLLVQESRHESSRSLSHSPGVDMEKLSPAKVDSNRSLATLISKE